METIRALIDLNEGCIGHINGKTAYAVSREELLKLAVKDTGAVFVNVNVFGSPKRILASNLEELEQKATMEIERMNSNWRNER